MTDKIFLFLPDVIFTCLIIFSIYRIALIYKYNDENSEVTYCHFTDVTVRTLLFIPVWINYSYEYEVEGKKYVKHTGMSSFLNFSDAEINSGVEVRYFKNKPRKVEFIKFNNGIRVFGWLFFIAFCLFCIVIITISALKRI